MSSYSLRSSRDSERSEADFLFKLSQGAVTGPSSVSRYPLKLSSLSDSSSITGASLQLHWKSGSEGSLAIVVYAVNMECRALAGAQRTALRGDYIEQRCLLPSEGAVYESRQTCSLWLCNQYIYTLKSLFFKMLQDIFIGELGYQQ